MLLAQIADIKCSIVETATFCSFAIVVPKLVVVTELNLASIWAANGYKRRVLAAPASDTTIW